MSDNLAGNLNHLEITVLMPCLNEAETLKTCVNEALQAINACGINGEVLIADNGSTDGSQQIARDAGARVVDIPEPGYGNALMGGINAARGTYVLMGDADQSYDFGELPVFLEKLREGNQLVMGCRLPKGGGTIEPGAMPWKHRWIGNPVLSSLGQIFFKAPVTDFHCGLRAFDREAIIALNLVCTGMEFASEMVVRSVVAQLTIDEVPITLRPDGRSRAPHLRSWHDGWRHLRFMLLFSPKWLFWYPGLALFIGGLLGMITLLPGPLNLGGISFDTNTLLVCATAIIIGAQTLFFAVFTKAYATQVKLLRPDRRIEKILSSHPVEMGIGVGIILFTGGFVYMLIAFLKWKSLGFGALSYPDSLRIVIPSVTAIALGIQSLFSGFALAILHLAHKD